MPKETVKIENNREHMIQIPAPAGKGSADGYYTLGVKGDKPPAPAHDLEVAAEDLVKLRKIPAFVSMEKDGDLRVLD